MLRGNHGVNVMLDGLLQQKSLRLSVFFRDRNKLFIELCVDCGTDFDCRPVGQPAPLKIPFYSCCRPCQDKTRLCFFFSSRRRHTRSLRDWSSDVCSSDLMSQRFAAEESDSLDARSDL